MISLECFFVFMMDQKYFYVFLHASFSAWYNIFSVNCHISVVSEHFTTCVLCCLKYDCFCSRFDFWTLEHEVLVLPHLKNTNPAFAEFSIIGYRTPSFHDLRNMTSSFYTHAALPLHQRYNHRTLSYGDVLPVASHCISTWMDSCCWRGTFKYLITLLNNNIILTRSLCL